MNKQYWDSFYWLKYKGRGIIQARLTSKQARSLFELSNILEIEYIKIVNCSKHNENKVYTVCKGRWFEVMNNDCKKEFETLA